MNTKIAYFYGKYLNFAQTKYQFVYLKEINFLENMDLTNLTKKYSNGEVTIVWKPSLCIHSTICWKHPNGLQTVFNPMVKPWINPSGAETKAIIDQIKKCPSGALSYFITEETAENA